MYKYIVYHITIHKGNEYYWYEQKKNPDNIPGGCYWDYYARISLNEN